MLDQLLRQLPIEQRGSAAREAEIEPLIAMGEEVLAEGDAERALSIFDQIAEMAPDHAGVIAGRARALLALGRVDEAEAALDALPEDAAKDARDRARARGGRARAERAAGRATCRAWRAQAAADPDDHGRALRARRRPDGGGRPRRRRRRRCSR